MKLLESKEFVHYQSSNLGIAWTRDFPMVAYLGVESGGRRRNHLDTNLLRPGSGGLLFSQETSSHLLASPAEYDENSLCYKEIRYPDGSAQRCEVQFLDDRRFTVKITALNGGKLSGKVFCLAFAPDVAPATLWANPRLDLPSTGKWGRSVLEAEPVSRYFDAPGVVSLPDNGLLSIESDRKGVLLHQVLVADKTNLGLNLGWANANNHTVRKAFHHGQDEVAVCLPEPVEQITLTFTVQPELLPDVGIDWTEEKWSGLKRCWHNSFTLNPSSLSMGDNIILGGTGHLAIHWKSDMSVFTPDLLPGVSLQTFFRSTLDRTFSNHTDEVGKMTGYGWENGGCNLLALYNYLLVTNDWDFIYKHQEKICKVVEYNLALDEDGDGIMEASYHGNHFHDPKTSLNWWDAFAFGHKDAYGNLVYYRAFRRVRKILEVLGKKSLIAKLDAFMDKFKANFHSVFFNEETGVYAGWISRDGRVHDYMFTFISAMAINEGLVAPELGRKVLQRLLDKLVENGYGEFKYGVPGPAIPVDVDDRTDWAPMADWGRYENGGFCGQTAYHFIQALYEVGMREEADRILFNMLDTFEHYPTHSGLNPGFCKSWDWRTRDGLPCGYNYLADNYVFLLAAVTGHHGVAFPQLRMPEK